MENRFVPQNPPHDHHGLYLHQQQQGYPIPVHQQSSSLSSTSQQIPQNFAANNDESCFQWMATSYKEVARHNSHLETQLSSLQQQYAEVIQQNEKIAASNDKLRGDNERLFAESLILQHDAAELNKNLEKEKADRAAEKKNQPVLKVKVEVAESNQEIVESLKEELKISREKVNVLEEENQVQAQRIRDLESVNHVRQNQKDNESELLIQENMAAHDLDFKTEIATLNQRIDDGNRENLRLQQNNIDLKRAHDLQKSQYEEEVLEIVTESQKQIDTERSLVKTLQKKLTDSEKCHETQVRNLDNDLAREKSQILILESKLKSSSEEVDLIKSEKDQNIVKNSQEVSKLDEELKKAEAELQQRDGIIQKLRSENEQAKLEFNSELESFKQKLESESKLLRQASTTALDQNSKIETLKREIEMQKAKMQIKENEITALNELLSNTQSEKNEAIVLANVLTAQMKCLKPEKKKLNEQLLNRLEEVQKLESEIKLLREKSKTDLAEFITAIDELELANKNIERKLEDSYIQVKSLEDKLNGEKCSTSHEKQSPGDLDAKIIELEGKVKESNEKLEGQTAEVNKQKGRVQHLLKQLLRRETDNAELQRKFDEVKKKELEQKKNNVPYHNDRKIAEVTAKNRDLEKSLKKCKSESVQHQNEIERLSNEKTELERKLQLKSSAKRELKNSPDCVDDSYKQLQELQAAQKLMTTKSNNQSQLYMEEISCDDYDDDDNFQAGPSSAKKQKRQFVN